MKNILVRNIDIERWKKTGKRVLVYGRRKTGKTFFIKNFTEWDEFFFVKRSGGVIDVKNLREVSYEYLKDIIFKEKNKRIVIDEFHRLPQEFLDLFHAIGENLNLVLITSTLWLSRKILSENSPLLGLFEEFKLGLIDERDAIKFLAKKLKGKELIDTCVYIREPWIIPILKRSVYEEIPRILSEEKNTIERLIGEVFREEERELTASYRAILSAIAEGKQKSTEISSYMYSKRLLQKDDPSLLQSYLKTLCNIGLIERIRILNKKFDFYFHSSPLLDLYFYLDSKYGFSEMEIPEIEIKKVFREKLPLHVEHFFRLLFSKLYGLKAGKMVEKNYDIDIVLFSFKKIEAVGEVKWKNKISSSEIKKIEEVLSKIKVQKKFLIVPEETALEKYPETIEVIDVKDIVRMLSQ